MANPSPAGKIIAAYVSPDPAKISTGGDRYNFELLKAWDTVASVTFAPVRYRWFLARCYSLAFILKYRRELRQAEYLFQAATSIYSSFWLIRWCRLLFPHLKHLGAAHHPRWMEAPGLKNWEREYLNAYDELIAISEHGRAELVSGGVHRPIHVLLPGRTRMPARTTAPAEPLRILWNGYLLERKGPLVLLEALTHLDDQPWHAHFVVASRPSPEIDRQFQQLLDGMEPDRRARIQVLDRLPATEFRNQFFQAKIFCLPSLVEGYSISTAEAMACGCAVVVPRTENFLELLGQSDYAGLYDPADPRDLVRTLQKLVTNNTLRDELAAYCLDRSRQLPDWEQFKEQARDLLQATLSARR